MLHPVASITINFVGDVNCNSIFSEWRGTLYPQKLALTSLTSGGRSVGIVRSRTQAMEFSLV
jgi:hypothetical protein